MTIYVCEIDIAAYHAQNFICWRLLGCHGARRNGRAFICMRTET